MKRDLSRHLRNDSFERSTPELCDQTEESKTEQAPSSNKNAKLSQSLIN
jgi:hypothetical protein